MRNFFGIFLKLNFWILFLIAVQATAIIFLCVYIPSFMSLASIFVLVWLLSAISATLLFLRHGAPEVKCVWFVIIASVPVAGALIYFLTSLRCKPHGILNVKGNQSGIARAANIACGTALAPYTRAVYFKNGTELFSSALPVIASAKSRVYIEFFIIARGKMFSAFASALESAIKNGAEVKIILDGLGSAFKIGKKELGKLKKMGAEVKIFNKLAPVPRAKLNLRDHRKIIAIDGKTAYTGGINLADEYANITSPYGFWKDTGVAVYGEAAGMFEGMFLAMWHGAYEMPAPAIYEADKTCLVYYDSPPARSFCEDAYISAISSARERVHIFTPYFCVSDKTASALAFAAMRGVDVKVIIPHIPDKKYAFEVTKAFAHNLTGKGVKFYEYTPGFIHAKSVICDNTLFMGSYNFDYRSTHFNYECGIMFENADICAHAELDFSESLALSSPLADGKPSRVKRLYRFILRFFAPLV